MSAFSFDFGDIKKQLACATLTDDQILQLMKTLQSKKSSKSVELSHEQKMLLQCCREHRNYAIKQDIDIVVCPYCGSVSTVENGTKDGRQRYLCNDCEHTFGDTNGTVLYHSKLSANQWIDLIKLTLQGESCRTIAKELHINKTTVLGARRRVCLALKEFVSNQDDFKGLAEGDEYYYPLSFKDIKDPMFFLGTLGRMPYTHRNQADRQAYVENQGFDLEYLNELEEKERLSKSELSSFVEWRNLQSQEKFSNALNQMDTSKVIEVLKTLNEQQKKKRGISNQQVCNLTCVDVHGNHFLQPVCVGRIQASHIEKHLVPHFSKDTILVTDSHRAYRTVANKHKIPLRQIPSGKHTSGGCHLGHVNGYHRNVSEFLHNYYGVSSKYLDYYLALCYWREKHKGMTYQEQAYEIITLLAYQAEKIPLDKFKDRKIKFDLKGILG